jgi:hypothetical protein
MKLTIFLSPARPAEPAGSYRRNAEFTNRGASEGFVTFGLSPFERRFAALGAQRIGTA